MGLMTPQQHTESLRDDRVVYLKGEKVEDVTTDPLLKICVETANIDYEMAEMPEYRDLAVVEHPETGEPISRYYYTPRTVDDLLKRHELMVTGTRLGYGVVPFTHDIGADAMNAVSITANAMGKPEYKERAEAYRAYLQKNDLSVSVAMSDVKGDRMLHPSSPKQAHPDYYVRVVDKNNEGITVRGAKAHITASAYFNEMFVAPCRVMGEEDSDYSLAFAIPASTRGIVHICHPLKAEWGPLDFPVDEKDVPLRAHTDCLVVFDDVFVPWERVFLCGESEHVMTLVYNFATLHRHTAASYRIPMTEILVGMAQAMAEHNGIQWTGHVRDKMIDLVMYLDTLKSLSRASCLDYVMHGDIPIPNPVICNIAKYNFAASYHNFARAIQDIAGGLLMTAPTYADYKNPEIGGYIEKYLGGKAGIPTEHRMRMFQLIRRWVGSELEVSALHAEGSLQAQRMMIYAESLSQVQEYKKTAEILAGIRKP